jgi:hypothetical protein
MRVHAAVSALEPETLHFGLTVLITYFAAECRFDRFSLISEKSLSAG